MPFVYPCLIQVHKWCFSYLCFTVKCALSLLTFYTLMPLFKNTTPLSKSLNMWSIRQTTYWHQLSHFQKQSYSLTLPCTHHVILLVFPVVVTLPTWFVHAHWKHHCNPTPVLPFQTRPKHSQLSAFHHCSRACLHLALPETVVARLLEALRMTLRLHLRNQTGSIRQRNWLLMTY